MIQTIRPFEGWLDVVPWIVTGSPLATSVNDNCVSGEMVSADPKDIRADEQRMRRTIAGTICWWLDLTDNGVAPFDL
jgi:hypothetical protein